MSNAGERYAARDADARAAAAKRARDLEAAAKLIDQERAQLLNELAELHTRELDPELRASEAPALLREIQALTYRLHHSPFHVDGPKLARVVGRSKQKIAWWMNDQPWLRTAPQASEDPAPGEETSERSEQPTPQPPQ